MFVSQTTAVTDMRNQTLGTESKEQKSVSRYSSSLLVSIVPTYHSSRMAVVVGKEDFSVHMLHSTNCKSVWYQKIKVKTKPKTRTPYVTMGGM